LNETGNRVLEMTNSSALDVTTAASLMSERKEYDLASQLWHELQVSARISTKPKSQSIAAARTPSTSPDALKDRKGIAPPRTPEKEQATGH
jgi:hypothetical protein